MKLLLCNDVHDHSSLSLYLSFGYFFNSQIFSFLFALPHALELVRLLGLFTCYTTIIAWNSTISLYMHLREIYFECTEHAFHYACASHVPHAEKYFCVMSLVTRTLTRARSIPLNLSRNPWIVVISGKKRNKKNCSIVDVDNAWWCWWCDLCCFF